MQGNHSSQVRIFPGLAASPLNRLCPFFFLFVVHSVRSSTNWTARRSAHQRGYASVGSDVVAHAAVDRSARSLGQQRILSGAGSSVFLLFVIFLPRPVQPRPLPNDRSRKKEKKEKKVSSHFTWRSSLCSIPLSCSHRSNTCANGEQEICGLAWRWHAWSVVCSITR